jgi:hypothetical protein
MEAILTFCSYYVKYQGLTPILYMTPILYKRVDVETQGTIGPGTLRCDLGREDELLEHMTELAREIAKKK